MQIFPHDDNYKFRGIGTEMEIFCFVLQILLLHKEKNIAHITERENYLMLSRGEVSHRVPKMSYGYDKNGTYPEPTGMISSSVIPMQRGEPGKPYKDYWGIEYTPTVETGGAALPTPGRFIPVDITK